MSARNVSLSQKLALSQKLDLDYSKTREKLAHSFRSVSSELADPILPKRQRTLRDDRNIWDAQSSMMSTVSTGGIKRTVWLFLNAMPEATRYRHAASAYEAFSVSLVIVLVVLDILSSVDAVASVTQDNLIYRMFEIITCFVFAAEYILRLWSCTESIDFAAAGCCWGRLLWASGFLAVVDLIVLLAFVLDLCTPSNFKLVSVIRMIRLLRLFALLKVERKTNSFRTIYSVLKSKRAELVATMFTAAVLMVMSSTLMYYLEHPAQPDAFSSIPTAMWWSVTALTTVGYGDIYPVTVVGKFCGSLVAFIGVGLFALPAGILGSGFVESMQEQACAQEEEVLEVVESEAVDIQKLMVEHKAVRCAVENTQRDVAQLHSELRHIRDTQSKDIQGLKDTMHTMLSKQECIMQHLAALRRRESATISDRYPKVDASETHVNDRRAQNSPMESKRSSTSSPRVQAQNSPMESQRSSTSSPRLQARTPPSPKAGRLRLSDRGPSSPFPSSTRPLRKT